MAACWNCLWFRVGIAWGVILSFRHIKRPHLFIIHHYDVLPFSLFFSSRWKPMRLKCSFITQLFRDTWLLKCRIIFFVHLCSKVVWVHYRSYKPETVTTKFLWLRRSMCCLQSPYLLQQPFRPVQWCPPSLRTHRWDLHTWLFANNEISIFKVYSKDFKKKYK